FDIMDGHFVPSHSINYEHLATVPMKLSWEAHLMVEHPENYLAGFRKAGAERIVFHHEATTLPQEVISQARKLDLSVGLALNPETKVSTVLPLIQKLDSILLLTVNPGFYGSPFKPRVLHKVIELRSAGFDMEIGIDGGIKETNIDEVARLGVDVIYVGSAIFMQPQPEESFRRLLAIAEEG
ncbi:ribulose-phosphate 3-epimerase, partial [Chloroflexota bacterium]